MVAMIYLSLSGVFILLQVCQGRMFLLLLRDEAGDRVKAAQVTPVVDRLVVAIGALARRHGLLPLARALGPAGLLVQELLAVAHEAVVPAVERVTVGHLAVGAMLQDAVLPHVEQEALAVGDDAGALLTAPGAVTGMSHGDLILCFLLTVSGSVGPSR